MEGLKAGSYAGIDDPRLGTIRAVSRRGINQAVIRNAILDLGIKPVEATLKWENLYSANRALIDRITPRLFFVESPALLQVKGVGSGSRKFSLPNHPDNKDLGERTVPLEVKRGMVDLQVASSDISSIREGEEIRLMGLFNVKIDRTSQKNAEAEFSGTSHDLAEKKAMKLIQWVPVSFTVATTILMPDATTAKGVSERNVLLHKPGEILQYVRFGFVRLEGVENEAVTAIFAHR